VAGRPNWRLVRRLGEGAFGESWLAEQRGTREPRVFKFCYDAQSLRGLRREIALFRLLKETLGQRPDITRVLDWNLDEAPYFIESEYAPGGSLLDWAERQGGIAAVPLAQRLEIAAQVAEALAAAHSVGVLHKDVKPANVLIAPGRGGAPRSQLTDFGIGMLLERERLAEAGITFRTELIETGTAGSGAGTLVYLAPEILEGKPVTLQADVYALGVLLFQLVVGDFARALAPGWERDVPDELLREEIAGAVDGNPQRRHADALRIAERLRDLDSRRARRAAELEERREAERSRLALARGRRRRRALAATAALSLAFAGAMALQARRIAREADRANREAETAQRVADFLVGIFQVSDPGEARGNSVTAREILDRGAIRIEAELAGAPLLQARLLAEVARVYQRLGLYAASEGLSRRALGALGDDAAPDDPLRLRLLHDLASNYWFWARWDDAEATYREVVEGRTRSLGPDHPDTLAARSDLASAYMRMGRSQEAERLSLEVLAAPDGASNAVAIGNLAEIYASTGRFEEAEAMAKRLVALVEERHGRDHPDALAAQGYLARVYVEQGRLAEAEQRYLSALADARRILGEDHPETVALRYELATVYGAQRRLDEAEAELRGVLAHDRALHGEAHPLVADERRALACVLLGAGRREEALGLLRENVAHGHPLEPTHGSCAAFREDPEVARLAAGSPAEPASR
jgi:tetratricopeptide (TPR) repeat protein